MLLFVGLAALATVPAWQSWTGGRTAEQTAPSVENTGIATDEPATADESASEATVAEEPAAEETVVAETAAEEPAAGPVVEEPAAEESVVEAPAVEEPATEEPMAEESTATSTEAGAAAVDAAESQAAESGSVKTASDGGADRLADIAQRLDAIESRLATAGAADDELSSLDQRIATLEQGGTAAVSDELASLSERVAGIEQLLIDFMTEVPADSLADVKTEVQRLIDENAGLREQLATLTARFEQTDSTAFMLAVGRLGAALNEGLPFEAELSTLRKLVAADAALGTATPALEILAPYAAEGAPSVAALGARFPDVARAIVQAAQQQGATDTVGADENGWFDRLIGRISELVTVRPVGDDVEGDGPAARVARAEARLATGDLASAANELDQLEGAPAEAAASWLAAAKARLAVVPAYRTLDSFALDRLGAGAGTAATDAAASTGSGG
jgi:uroporphyrinogen-III synthase